MSTGRRRVLMGTGIGVGVLAAAVGGLFGVYIPHAVRGRVEAMALRRGLAAEVGTVEPGLSELVLHDLRLRSADGGVVMDVDRIGVGAGVFDLAMEGSAAVSEVDVRGVRAVVDLHATDIVGTLRRLRGQDRAEAEPEAAPGDSGDSTARTVIGTDLALTVRDRAGVVLAFENGTATLASGEQVSASFGPFQIGSDGPDGLVAERVELDLRKEGGDWALVAASLADPSIRYRERDGDVRSPLWDRLRRHGNRLRGEDDAGEAAGGSTSEDSGESESLAELVGAGLRSARERLGADASLTVTGLSVTASSNDGERRILRELEAEVAALSDDRLRLEGSGRPGRGGRLGWNLTLEPEALRAEGDVDFQRLPFALIAPLLPSIPWHRPEDARLSGELTIRGEGSAPVHVEGRVAVDELAVSGARIAPRPVRRIAVSVTGEADWLPTERRLDLERATFTLGEASANLSGFLEWPDDHYELDVSVTLPPTDCNTAVSAIPADLLAELAGFTFSGQLAGRVHLQVDSRDLDGTELDIDIANGCAFLTAPAMADVTRFEGPFRHRVLEPDGTTFEMETGPGTLTWTPISQISPFLVHAVLGHEDAGFFRHEGFATHAIRLALIRNLEEGRYVYGASTITMQLVKNVFLHREKTIARKIQEVLLTWWVESVMAKERILELYLNVIEYGPGVYGIRSAAEHYFGRAPSELGPAESAYLATILPNPKRFHVHWEEESIPDAHRRRTARFLRTLARRGRYDAPALERGIEELEVLTFYRPGRPLPRAARTEGRTAPLPIVTAELDRSWEDELGPDDPNAMENDNEGW